MTQQEAEVTLKVNNQEAIDKINELEKKSAELRKQFNEAFAKGDTTAIRKTTQELNRTNKEIQAMGTNAANIRAAMQRLDQASPKDLQRTIKMINSELNSGRVPRGTKEWRDYVEQLKRAKAELEKVNEEMRDQEGIMARLKNKFNGWGAAAAAGIAALTGLVFTGKQAVQTYAEMQQEEANVRKFTGMTAEEVESLNAEFKKLDTRTSRQELNKLAQEAGRLGKSSQEDVLGFVKAANQINVALDDLGEGATLTLSKLTGIFGDEARLGTERSLLAVGSVINELSQNCTASAPYLADFSKRLAGVGAQAGMTIPQIMGFAAVLDTQGQAVEMSATAFSTLILKLYKDPAKFAKVAGLDVKKFSDILSRDANEAVLTLLESLGKMGNIEALAPMFQEMGMDGARASGVLAALAGNIDFVRSQQTEANKAFREATSITKEYEVQNTTVQAGLEKAKKGFTEMAVALGQKLAPVMRYCISGTSQLMRTMLAIIEVVVKYKTTIITLTASVVAYYTAMKWAEIYTKACAAAKAVATTAAIAYKAAMFGLAGVVRLASGNIRAANAVFATMSKMLKTTPFGLAVAALGAIATSLALIWDNARKAADKLDVLSDIQRKAVASAEQESDALKRLYEITQDQNVAMSERIQAADLLHSKYPDTFADLTNEEILAGKAKDAYDELTKSIIRNAEIRAAQEQLTKLQQRKVEIESTLTDASDLTFWDIVTGFAGSYSIRSSKPGQISDELRDIEKQIDKIVGKYGVDLYSEDSIVETALAEVTSGQSSRPQSSGSSSSSTSEKDRRRAIKEALDAEKARIEQEQALNTINYVTGEKDYAQYLNKKKILDMAMLDNQIEVLKSYGETESKEYADLLLKRAEFQKRWLKDSQAESLRDIEQHYQEQKDLALDAFLDTNGTVADRDKAFKQNMLQAEFDYLQAKLQLYKDDAQKRLEIEKQISTLINKDREEKARENAQRREEFENKYLRGKSDSFKKNLENIQKLEADGIISEKEAAVAQHKELVGFLESIGQDFSASILDLGITIFESLNGMGAGTADIIQASLSVMTAALSQFSDFVNAERDLELAKIEKKYDREIEAAGTNKKKVAEIEKRKEAEVAATKKKYNDRAMKIEIAQAIAQTAQAAIAAYASAAAIPVTGWVMAPIAAGLATAAGLMQIATIKKQHEAQAAGYYEGGFTGGHDYRREAGVVHGGEFVANHNAVNNAQLAPVLRLIDYAQRNNTVARLTADDVALALGRAPGVSARGGAASSATTTVVNNTIDVEPISRLAGILERGIDSRVVMTGEDGLARQYERYQKLNSNPKR